MMWCIVDSVTLASQHLRSHTGWLQVSQKCSSQIETTSTSSLSIINVNSGSIDSILFCQTITSYF